jgi:hypothetical protein
MPDEIIHHEVCDAEQLEAEARVKADLAYLEAIWADELVINATENIIYTKDHFLLRLSSGQVRYRSFQRTISKLTSRDNVAVTSGNESIVPANGPDADKAVLCSYLNVWIRGARWQLIGRQVAVIVRAPEGASWVF